MLQNLLEVVSAFHIGRGGTSMSYMGRGVTRCATLCLRHLAYEMATQLHSQDWPRKWLFTRQATPNVVGESGLHWLTPLWTYRDAEVRAAGLGIAVALTMTETGRITMTTQCQHITGGIWGACFSILLDQSECSIVREQAALLLVNLTSQPLPTASPDTTSHVWQGPVVRNQDTQEVLVGCQALLALLHHSQFYTEMSTLLSNYYPQPAIRPVSVAHTTPTSTTIGSQLTMTTSGSASPPLTAVNSSQVSSQGTTSHRIASTPGNDTSFQTRPHAVGQHGDGSNPNSPSIVQNGTSASVIAVNVADGSNATSTTDATFTEYQSVTTPCLVAAICQLLNNLVTMTPQDTLLCLNGHGVLKDLIGKLDLPLCEAYIRELSTGSAMSSYLLAFRDLVRLNTAIIRLYHSCVLQDASIRSLLIMDKPALRNCLLMVTLTHIGDTDLVVCCERLCESVFMLLTTLLAGQDILPDLSPILVKNWKVFQSRCIGILEEDTQTDTPVWLSCLHFLATLFCEEGKALRQETPVKYSIASALDRKGDGAILCRVLIRVFDRVSLRTEEAAFPSKLAVVNALKSLLAISVQAKSAALQDGLVETLCEYLKALHNKLNMATLDAPLSMAPTRKKDNPLLSEIVLLLDLLRNFMFNNQDVKVAAYECELANILHRLWAWCQMEGALMAAVLSLMSAYIAHCSQACRSLCCSSATAIDERGIAKVAPSGHSLLHCLIKLVQKGGSSVTILRQAYAVLATLALSQEARGILIKSNFVNDFASLCPSRTKKTKVQRVVEGLWLDLLLNLSFSTDGQTLLLKIDGGVGLLLEFGVSGNFHHEHCALLILRNLAFHTTNKPKLLANEKLVPFLLRCIDMGSEENKSIASNALLALVYNSNKAKVNIKTNHVICKLQDQYNTILNHAAPTANLKRCAENIQDVLMLLRS